LENKKRVVSCENKPYEDVSVAALLGAVELDQEAQAKLQRQDKEIREKVDANSLTSKILFLASNPSSTTKLKLADEFQQVHAALQEAKLSSQFVLKQSWFATPSKLMNGLEDEQPRILHFSGHGKALSGKQSEIEAQYGLHLPGAGILMQDEQGKEGLVTPDALGQCFGYLKAQGYTPEIVLLNACHSESQAYALAQYAQYVIGTSHEVKDDASIAFARAFYEGLGKGQDVPQAFSRAKALVAMNDLPNEVFVLYIGGEKQETRTDAALE
jgi:CHAT domain-containing protein